MKTENDVSENRGRGRDTTAPKAQPWNLYRIVEVTKRNGDKVDEWIECGVAWPMKEREGFSFTLYFAIPEGSRMAIMPRESNGGRR